MIESVEFLISLILCLVYIAVPVGLIGGVCYFFGQRRQEKRLEAKKDYSRY
ncbi:MAG: hypothetical protein ACLUKQ_05625 [Peptococcaceae bacterium]